MKRIRSGAGRSRQQPRIGAPDPALTANAGLAAITELCDRLGVIAALDAAVGPVKQRDRGFGAGELLAGIAAAQLAGEDFLTGLDRQRADAAGQQITPVPGLASTTAAGLARRVTPAQWRAVEAGLAVVTGRMLALLPAPRADALAGGPVTIDLDTTDVEVYGRKKRGVAYNHQGQRVGRPHVATWAEAEIVLAADLGDGTDDPRATAPDLLRRALASLPERARASGRVALRADAGYFAGALARAALQSTFKRLTESFKSERLTYVGRVHYVDFDTTLIPDNNTFAPYVYKRPSFEHEHEIRAVTADHESAWKAWQQANMTFDPTLSLRPGQDIDADLVRLEDAYRNLDPDIIPRRGLLVPVDLERLVEAVYIAPEAVDWFAELVEKLLRRYGRGWPVRHSDLNRDPVY